MTAHRIPPPIEASPEVMTRWCAAVGLNASEILARPFGIEHGHAEGLHVAVYRHHRSDRPTHLAVDVLPIPCAAHPEVPSILASRQTVTAGRPGVIDARMCEVTVRETPSVSVAVSFDPGDQDAALSALELAVEDARRQIEESRS